MKHRAVRHRAAATTIARATVAGGIMTAGACALIGAAPAQAQWGHHHNSNPTSNNSNTTNNKPSTQVTPNVTPAPTPLSLAPKWPPGTYNTTPGFCTSAGQCFVPQPTTPFPLGTTPTTATGPIVANPNGTGLIIG